MGRTATQARTAARISWDTKPGEATIIRAIARRAREWELKHGLERDLTDIQMDITATHCNGNPLRLQDLLDADDFNFIHDVAGIRRHLDRTTGKLQDMFSPRFSKREN